MRVIPLDVALDDSYCARCEIEQVAHHGEICGACKLGEQLGQAVKNGGEKMVALPTTKEANLPCKGKDCENFVKTHKGLGGWCDDCRPAEIAARRARGESGGNRHMTKTQKEISKAKVKAENGSVDFKVLREAGQRVASAIANLEHAEEDLLACKQELQNALDDAAKLVA